jgi:hypothetical protein
VLADSPSIFYPMGSVAAAGTDATANGSNATVGPDVTAGTTDPFGSASALTFNGNAQSTLSSPLVPVPAAFSLELWFNTTTSAGGKLLGFGNRAGPAVSTVYDRHIYMDVTGHLKFGTYIPAHLENGLLVGNAAFIVTTTGTYNDGNWHHVVATQGAAGTVLYVDGAVVGSDSQTAAEPHPLGGYWRVGGDNLIGWFDDPIPDPNAAPIPRYFTGQLSDVAIYAAALTPAQIAAHLAAATAQF